METLKRALETIWSLRPRVNVQASKSGVCVAASHFGVNAHGSLSVEDQASEAEGVTGATTVRRDSVSTEVKLTGGEHSVELTFGLSGKQVAKGTPSPSEEIPEDVDHLG